MTTYRIVHETSYNYPDDVNLSHSQAHLTARTGSGQTRVGGSLRIEPVSAVTATHADYFGNRVTHFTVQEPHKVLRVTAVNEVQVHPPPAPEPTSTLPWEAAREATRLARDPVGLDAYQFAFDSPLVRAEVALSNFAAPSFTPGRSLLEASIDLAGRIHSGFKFDPSATTISTPLFEILALRRGVCQDFAHLMIGSLRSLGLAARYVSGYVRTTPPPGRPRLVGADVSHAWVSVFCPPLGWVDIDPTNNLIPGPDHVTLAWGRDYDDVSPLKGVILGGGRHGLEVSVEMTPIG